MVNAEYVRSVVLKLIDAVKNNVVVDEDKDTHVSMIDVTNEIDSSDTLLNEKSFVSDFGFDSLMAVTFANRLSVTINIQLPSIIILFSNFL